MQLELKTVNFSYKNARRKTLSEIDCVFMPGNFYGIYGPNGSGKSSLLKLISAEIKPDSGSIIYPFPAQRRAQCLSLLEQNIPPHIPLSVKEIVSLGQYPWRREKYHKEQVDTIMQSFSLLEFSARQYSQLSGGEKQRVMLARAMLQSSDFVLLDEPESSLDLKHRIFLYEYLRKAADQGSCIIMVSQELFLSPRYLDQSILMKAGSIKKQGKSDEIMTKDNIQEVFDCLLPEII